MYKPTEIDLQWAKNSLTLLQDGALLAYPSYGLVYRVSHAHHTLVLQNPEVLAIDAAIRETHERTIAVMEQVGYQVVTPLEQDDTGLWKMHATSALVTSKRISNLQIGNQSATTLDEPPFLPRRRKAA